MTSRLARFALLTALTAAAVTGAPSAQSAGSTAKAPVTNEVRLFQRFIEDGAVTDNVRLEGQARLQLYDHVDALSVGPILAVNVAEDIELGGRVNLLAANPDPGDSETGFTDLDIYGKIRVTTKPTQVSLGILLKLPTGDEESSLLHGTGETDVGFFAGVRHDFASFTLVGNAGLRINQDPDSPAGTPGLPASPQGGLDGENSLQLGGAILFPMTARIVGVVEASLETERVDGAGSDFRLTLGADWRRDESFGLRFAVAGGSGDSAPEFEAIASAVLFF